MALIDIGPGASDRNTTQASGYTWIDKENPANDTGWITEVKLWLNTTGAGVKVGTLFGAGTDLTSHDSATIGDVTAGSEQTFSGLNIAVSSGEFIGWYSTSGNIECESTGGTALLHSTAAGDHFDGVEFACTGPYTQNISIYGTGATVAVGGGAMTLQSTGGFARNYATGGAGIILIGF